MAILACACLKQGILKCENPYWIYDKPIQLIFNTNSILLATETASLSMKKYNGDVFATRFC